MSTQNKAKKKRYYWIALNGPSVAATTIPLSKNLSVSPTPEQLLGFSTYDEAKRIQHFLLTSPMEEVVKYIESLPPRIRSGEVQYIRPTNPEPYTEGITAWHDGPALVA
ncbi:MAG: hypothetical protein KF774_18295 [Planctomyces sp.]|nr:hypothetical protein [Planctomyces sp.]